MKLIITFALLLLPCFGYAVSYPVISIVDTDGHMLKPDANGRVVIKFVSTATAPTVKYIYPNVTLIDTDSEKINIGSDGTINLVTK